MVAITVILAAVIASFVIGLGGDQTTRPSTTFEFDYDGDANDGDGQVTISHSSGETLQADNIQIVGPDGEIDSPTEEFPSEVGAGASATVNVNSDWENGWEMEIVWDDPNSDKSFTLNSFEDPDA